MDKKKICGRVWLVSLNAPQIFFLTVHFCMILSRMWQGFMCCLFRIDALKHWIDAKHWNDTEYGEALGFIEPMAL